MAVEAKRGCGYRKVGGLYMVSGKLSAPCGRLPLEVHVCPTCKGGIKQTRGWTWVDAAALLASAPTCREQIAAMEQWGANAPACDHCPASPPHLAAMGKSVGLVWVGGSFYPEAADFMREASELGVSRRIPAVPRGFKLGETWVLIAHPKAITRRPATEDEQRELDDSIRQALADGEPVPGGLVRKGVITMFKPIAIEKIVTETQSQDAAAMAELAAKGITPVVVPDDDKDHQGSVHDKDDDEPQSQLGLENGHDAPAAAVQP